MKKLLGAISVLGIAAAMTLSAVALADDPFDLKISPGKVEIDTKSGWHINKDYPWKLTAGDLKLDKSKFTLTETSAVVSGAPKGTAKLKGAVCSGEKCQPFEKDVTVP